MIQARTVLAVRIAMTIHDTMPATQLAQFVRSVYRLTAGAVLERERHEVVISGYRFQKIVAMNMKMSHRCDISPRYSSTIFWTLVWISADAIVGETVLKISIFLFSLTLSGSSVFSMALTPSVM